VPAPVIKKPSALTVRNLQGTWDLKTDAMPVDDDGFNKIPEIPKIDANTLTFAPTFVGMGPFTLAGNGLRITGDYTDVVQATLSDTGNPLMLIDGLDEDVETCVFTRRAGHVQ
jgi:hypothetical protein